MEITCTSNGRSAVPSCPAQLGQPGEQAGQVRRVSPAVQPAVPDPGRAAQRGVAVAADQDRDAARPGTGAILTGGRSKISPWYSK